MNVYFIPGLSANPICFEYLDLPEGYQKKYIDWIPPRKDEPLDKYSERMAEIIDKKEDFIIVGFSFGGVIAQYISIKYNPKKTILLSSFNSPEQRPNYFKVLNSINFTFWFPMRLFSDNNFVSYLFLRDLYFKYNNRKKEIIKIDKYLTHRDRHYLKWSIKNVISWKENFGIENLYQIHGTNDIVFPYKKIEKYYGVKEINKDNLYKVEGGTHIMVLEKPKKINKILEEILLKG